MTHSPHLLRWQDAEGYFLAAAARYLRGEMQLAERHAAAALRLQASPPAPIASCATCLLRRLLLRRMRIRARTSGHACSESSRAHVSLTTLRVNPQVQNVRGARP